ncbi:MAG: 2-hydroxyacyl-CoA dehydratase family protein [Roseburia sp.]|nr:2-hydroxyacyl-CoA dehydratase family protein [Roseburia sp.]MCM1098356.1 2-hydroxyacyl-CoA dehydratase family protein [Ruminococcus flavefaciens]
MRDLKHLYELEKLLLEANNELVREAAAEGRVAIGGVCAQIPEPLLNLPGCFQVRLRAPRTGSVEMGTYYMSSILCECCRAILERALEGGYRFLDCIVAPDACAQMNRCVENIEHLKLGEGEKFFVTYADVPMKSTGSALKHYVKQMRLHVLEPLRERFGINIGDGAIREAVAVQNEVSRLIREMGEYRKEENPRITGYEFAVFCLATYCCPQDKLLPALRETVEELKNRQPDGRPAFRARVVLAGSEIDDPDLIRLIEETGAYVAADRYCLGSFPNRGEIALNEEEDALTQVCRTYIQWGQCPRFMNTEKILERQRYLDGLAREYHVDGIILQQLKFCDYWGYERAHLTHVMREEYGWPVLSVDRPYTAGNSGQLRTRVQAFVESMEIKKIAAAKQI